MATTTPLLGRPVALRRRESSLTYFIGSVTQARDQIERDCPAALAGITVLIEDVPTLTGAWSRDRVPLAASYTATLTSPATVVVFRRPLEHRAASRRGLDILVYRTIVEQLAALTGLEIATIDPSGRTELDD